MILRELVGKTRFVATRVVGLSNGTRPPFYRIAEVYFPSLQALQACAPSAGGRACPQDLQRRDAAFSCRGKAHAHIWRYIGAGPAESARISSIEGLVQ